MSGLGEVVELFHQKKLQSIPFRTFPPTQVDEAFRYMSKGKHIGKVLIQFTASLGMVGWWWCPAVCLINRVLFALLRYMFPFISLFLLPIVHRRMLSFALASLSVRGWLSSLSLSLSLSACLSLRVFIWAFILPSRFPVAFATIHPIWSQEAHMVLVWQLQNNYMNKAQDVLSCWVDRPHRSRPNLMYCLHHHHLHRHHLWLTWRTSQLVFRMKAVFFIFSKRPRQTLIIVKLCCVRVMCVLMRTFWLQWKPWRSVWISWVLSFAFPCHPLSGCACLSPRAFPLPLCLSRLFGAVCLSMIMIPGFSSSSLSVSSLFSLIRSFCSVLHPPNLFVAFSTARSYLKTSWFET